MLASGTAPSIVEPFGHRRNLCTPGRGLAQKSDCGELIRVFPAEKFHGSRCCRTLMHKALTICEHHISLRNMPGQQPCAAATRLGLADTVQAGPVALLARAVHVFQGSRQVHCIRIALDCCIRNDLPDTGPARREAIGRLAVGSACRARMRCPCLVQPSVMSLTLGTSQ